MATPMPKDTTSTPPAEIAIWDLWQDAAHSPGANMALDEALLLDAPRRGRPLLRFYTWDRVAVSIGYVQKFTSAPREGYAVVRRPTGGGVVYHDHDFTYTVVIPPGHWLTGLDRTLSYDWINRAVLAGLEYCRVRGTLAEEEIPRTVDRSTMVCFQSPTRYDIMLGNRKIGGSAQRRMREGILHQGSIHFGAALPTPKPHLRDMLQRGFARVLNVEFTEFTPAGELLALAARLATERYDTPEWNQRR